MTFGEKLQYLRKEQNWTQEQLADQIGISPAVPLQMGAGGIT